MNDSAGNYPPEGAPAEATVDALLGQSLKSIAEQLIGPGGSATLWLVDGDHGQCRLHLVLDGGTVLAASQSGHVSASRLVDIDELCAGPARTRHSTLRTLADIGKISPEKAAYLRSLGVRATLVLPMLLEERLVGAFTVRIKEGDPDPSAERIELTQALVRQSALALQMSCLAKRAQAAAIAREQEMWTKRTIMDRADKLARVNRAMHKSLGSISDSAELDKMLGTILATIAEQLDETAGGVWLYDGDRNLHWLHINLEEGVIEVIPESSMRGYDFGDFATRTRRETDRLSYHEAVLCDRDDLMSRPIWAPFRDYFRSRGTRSMLIVPMFAGDTFLGSIAMRSRTHDAYSGADIEFAQTLANQAAAALHVWRLAEVTRRAAVVQEQEAREAALLEERNRIAGEIHDSLAHAFTGIIMQLQASKALRGSSAEIADQCVDRAFALATEGMREARRSVAALVPEAIQVDDLPQRLRLDIEHTTADTGVMGRFDLKGTARSLPADVSLNLLRIAQEALSNAQRYASATHILIVLEFSKAETVLRIQDDGIGFDEERTKDHGGFGLLAMQRRAHRIGAALKLSSAPGEGTKIEVRVPQTARQTASSPLSVA